MIKLYILFFFLLFFSFQSFSQDVIITQAGDSIKCKIEDETPVMFLFSQQKKSTLMRSQIFKTMVKDFRYNYKQDVRSGSGTNVVKQSSEDADGIDKKAYKNYMRYVLTLNVGKFYGNKLIESGILPQDYLQKLKNGGVFGIKTDYYLNDHLGFGLQYQNYSSHNELSESNFKDFTGTNTTGKLSDKANFRYVGGQINYRQYLNYKMLVSGSFSLGYVFYSNQISRAMDKGIIKSKGFFNRPNIGFDYLVGNDIIGRDISLGLEFAYLFGNLNEQQYQSSKSIDSFTFPQTNNLNRLDINLTLKFYKFPKYLKLTSL